MRRLPAHQRRSRARCDVLSRRVPSTISRRAVGRVMCKNAADRRSRPPVGRRRRELLRFAAAAGRAGVGSAGCRRSARRWRGGVARRQSRSASYRRTDEAAKPEQDRWWRAPTGCRRRKPGIGRRCWRPVSAPIACGVHGILASARSTVMRAVEARSARRRPGAAGEYPIGWSQVRPAARRRRRRHGGRRRPRPAQGAQHGGHPPDDAAAQPRPQRAATETVLAMKVSCAPIK